MVIIETENWGAFKGSTPNEAKEKLINTIAPTDSDNIKISWIDCEGIILMGSFVKKIESEIELEIYEWRRVAEIESRGLARAQQESMEG